MAHPGQRAGDDEVPVGEEIDELLSRANPNPERVGCPPRETLIALARRAQPLGDPAYEHLVKCSPCYREFRALQEEGRTGKAVPGRRWMWASAAAVLALVLAGGFWFTRVTFAPTPSTTPSAQQDAKLRTELDLRKYAVLRSDEPSEQMTPLTLPVGLVDMTLLLPVGSEPGTYDIQLLDANLKSRAEARGEASIRDYITTVRATVDFRTIPAGQYQLALRRAGDDWRLYPAEVR